MNYRIEKDTMGDVQVPSEKYWGAQTQRSINNFEQFIRINYFLSYEFEFI